MISLRSCLVVVIVAMGVTACEGAAPTPGAADNGGDGVLPPPVAARVLVDRNWIDRLPRNAQDRLHVLRFTPAMGGGVYQDRTLFAGSFELFLFRVRGRELGLGLPHTRERLVTTFRIRHVKDQEPFDLVLELEHSPRGPRVYYGSSKEGHGELDVTLWLSRLVPGLAAAAGAGTAAPQ